MYRLRTQLPAYALAVVALLFLIGGADADPTVEIHSGDVEWNYTAEDYTCDDWSAIGETCTGWIMSVAMSADGEYTAAGSQEGKVYLFDKDNNTPLWSYEDVEGEFIVDISADGEYIVAGAGDSYVYLFNKDSSTPLWSYEGTDHVKTIAISADGEYIVASDGENSINLFHRDSSTPLWSYSVGNWGGYNVSSHLG